MERTRWYGSYILAGIALLVVTVSPKPGVTWDEPGYLAQGQQYADWLRRVITAGAGPNDPLWVNVYPDHPPLAKLVYGLAAAIRPASVPALSAARAASALLFAVLVGLTAFAAKRCFGPLAGWLAGGCLLLTPQVLAHAQLAALDLPITLAWMAAAVLSLTGPVGWPGASLLGVLWGAALLTKVNGVFLAGPLFAWGLITRRLRWIEAPVVIILAAVTVWDGWPWLQHDTFAHLSAYLLDKQVRWIVPTFYMGHVYNESYPPWHYPLVLTLATLPLAVVVGLAIGTYDLVRERPRASLWLALHLSFTLGLACLPGVPRYDGARLFLPAFPFIAVIAGAGLARLLAAIAANQRLGMRAAAAVTVVAAASAVLALRTAAPCLLSAYSPLVGGLEGAARLGLETTFWGDAITPELLGAVPRGASVGAIPLGIEYMRAVQDAGLLPPGARPVPEDRSDVLIILGRKGMMSDGLRHRYETSATLAETRRGGVALAKLVPGDLAIARP